MNIDSFILYCLSKPFTSQDFPFGEETLVFRVKGKIFALTGLEAGHLQVNLKYDTNLIDEIRDKYEEVQPGYHMNKRHWNTVDFEGKLSDKILKELIDHSYSQVVKGLSKKDRIGLE